MALALPAVVRTKKVVHNFGVMLLLLLLLLLLRPGRTGFRKTGEFIGERVCERHTYQYILVRENMARRNGERMFSWDSSGFGATAVEQSAVGDDTTHL